MIVYSLPTCGQCKVLKMKLAQKNIQFEEIDDLDIMKSKGILGVPVLEFDDGTKLTSIDAIKWVGTQEKI